MDKVVASAADAVADIPDGASMAVGGFGICGIPSVLIQAILDRGTTDLTVASNNCGIDGWGLGILLSSHRVAKVIASYVGENKEFERQFLHGEIEVELNPQGTLAERLRAAGTGIPAFYTPAGVGTVIVDGGLPLRYGPDGTVTKQSEPRETRVFNGREYALEEALVCDFALVRAWKGDRHGNLIYREAAQNFNPLCAGAGVVTIAEVEELVEPGELDPSQVHTPGILVQRVVHVGQAGKRIERRTVRPAPSEA